MIEHMDYGESGRLHLSEKKLRAIPANWLVILFALEICPCSFVTECLL
jgi:hypothetical protein